MVNGIRRQKPSPKASAVACGVAPKPSAKLATSSTPTTANTHASGNQRSAKSALRNASRSGRPARGVAVLTPPRPAAPTPAPRDRKSVVQGTRVAVRVNLGGRRIIKQKKPKTKKH